ncbi:MAG: CYTH domain-containing protein [Chloroflexota bacterium]|nr:CYTH domain-containing protein [Chloroflexota bacterium]
MVTDAPAVETEAKLRASRRAFRALAAQEVLEDDQGASWRVVQRRDLSLRDTYWDTPDGRLARANGTLRVREHGDDTPAELTLKGPLPRQANQGATAGWSRTELTVAVPGDSGPADWAQLPQTEPVITALQDLGVDRSEVGSGVAGLSQLRADIVLLNPRRDMLLERDGQQCVLSLDEVRIEGQPYARRYVEIELKHGPATAVDRLAGALAQRYGLRPSRQAKVAAARAWLAKRRASTIT